MRLLVTGGAGFIGSNLVRYFLEDSDYEIVNFDALTYAGNLENLADVADNPRYTFVHGDIRDEAQVMAAMKGCQKVIHLAAESHVDRSISDPMSFLTTNVMGTQVLLNCARASGIEHFHHVSTDEVFGSLLLDDPQTFFDEFTPYDPRSPYSASKAASDHFVRATWHTYGLPVTISNCSNNYGPYQFPEKVIPLYITNALRDLPLPVYGEGVAVRDYLHVWDHCRAIDMILRGGMEFETFCVGGDSERSTLQVAKAILAICGKPESLIQHVPDRPGHDKRYAINHDYISETLGWYPSGTFEQGLLETVRWYVDNPSWWLRIISKEYLDTNRAAANQGGLQ